MDWRERYERAAERYAAGETREPDERQLVQLANSAWAAGLSLLMAGDRDGAREWLRRSADRYRESWDAGDGTDAWGRPRSQRLSAKAFRATSPTRSMRSRLRRRTRTEPPSPRSGAPSRHARSSSR